MLLVLRLAGDPPEVSERVTVGGLGVSRRRRPDNSAGRSRDAGGLTAAGGVEAAVVWRVIGGEEMRMVWEGVYGWPIQ